MNKNIEQATICKKIQLEENEYQLSSGKINKIFIKDRYFFVYTKEDINYSKDMNLLLFYHGSRDIAMNCILSSTSLISTFGDDPNWIVVFGQCDGNIQIPYIHHHFKKVAYGEIYWGITGVQNMNKDMEYTKNIIEIMEKKYKINKKAILGHSNGGVFSTLIPIYLPNIFDFIISHQGGMGFDPLFGLNFDLVKATNKKPKLLFYTGNLDVHKNVCKIAHQIFLAEQYKSEIIIIDKLNHNYKKECEIIIKDWIEKNYSE